MGTMPRTLRDAKLDTRAARLRLKARRGPYWRSISQGLAVGYRKGVKGGTWIARHYSGAEVRRYEALGTADDIADADGQHVLSFAQAQEAARKWFADLARQDQGEAQIGLYCQCAAEKAADAITPDEVQYIATNQKIPPSFTAKTQAIAQTCRSVTLPAPGH